ncbi:hypothetical protein L6452_00124 [Arctium lappa]|uniref:Uncharacterized protein n=1 Tax=Arctium lappa TaxID=4217 RepID=A0ACB9FCG0_ARCLA|nr:hypothetical protein L6452_00124 [Arctium lappa]
MVSSNLDGLFIGNVERGTNIQFGDGVHEYRGAATYMMDEVGCHLLSASWGLRCYWTLIMVVHADGYWINARNHGNGDQTFSSSGLGNQTFNSSDHGKNGLVMSWGFQNRIHNMHLSRRHGTYTEVKREVELVDEELSGFDENEVKRRINVALLCTQTSPTQRPSTSRVVYFMISSEKARDGRDSLVCVPFFVDNLGVVEHIVYNRWSLT